MWGHSETPYKVLGVKPGATEADVKAAHRALAHRFHPDKGGAETTMALINAAYSLLSNAKQRALYDKHFAPKCPICNGKGYVMGMRGFKPVKQKCRDCAGE